MTRTPGHAGAPHPGGYETGPGTDLDDDDPDLSVGYDGGLQAAADGGRVARFQGPGSTPADVDSPFLGLFKRGEPGAPPVEPKTNGHGRKAPVPADLPVIDPLQLPPMHAEPTAAKPVRPLPQPPNAKPVPPVSAGQVGAGPVGAGPVGAGPVGAGPVAGGSGTGGPMAGGPMAGGPMAGGPMAGGPVAFAPVVPAQAAPPPRMAGPAPEAARSEAARSEAAHPSVERPEAARSGAARPETVHPTVPAPAAPVSGGANESGQGRGERSGRRGRPGAPGDRRTVRRRPGNRPADGTPAQSAAGAVSEAAEPPPYLSDAYEADPYVTEYYAEPAAAPAVADQSAFDQPPMAQPTYLRPPVDPHPGQPAGFGPAGFDPAGYNPAGSDPAGFDPAGFGPIGAAPVGSVPTDPGPAGARPAGHQPTDARPADQQPADAQPAGQQPADPRPADHEPTDHRPADHEPADHEPADFEFVDYVPPAATPPPAGEQPPPRGRHSAGAEPPPRMKRTAPQTDERGRPLGEEQPDKPRRHRRSRLDKTPKPKHRDRDPAVELAITEIAGHLTFTPNSVTAWYTLPEVRWAFRPDADREALLMAISEQYAGLAGFRLHLRRTSRPFPADQWARVLDRNTAAPLPNVDGAPSWGDHLVAAQQHLIALNHAEGQTFLGITFARRTLGDTFSERIGRLFNRGVADAERRRMSRTVEQFDEVLGAFGMRGRRVTAEELEFLLYRSVALGMAPPAQLSSVEHGTWERGDLLALTEQIERYRTPYGSTVKLVNRLTGEERHAAVLAVGRMEPLEIPERHEPWLHFHERLPWAMELSSRVDVLGPGESFRNLEHRLRLIRSQQQDYAEHSMDAPPELERLAMRALTIGDDMTTGLPVDSSRAHGWHRIAVSGRTREECLERARRLTQLYSREMRVSLQHPKNQDWLAREFIPGEPLANTGYLRRMPIKLFAAALPQAASTVGDRRGDLIGRTAGTSRRPVFLDLHFPMEVRERSGLAVFVAEPGGGKSTLMGALGYLAARRGVQVTLLDPSGPLARLCQMPEVRPYAHVLNLTGSEQGTLAPYALIPTPQRTHFAHGTEGDREFDIALSNARAERRMLVQDICMMLVPPQVAREASTATLLRHAARQVPAEEMSTMDDVVRILRDMGDHDAHELSNLLLDAAEMPLAMLFFGRPPEGSLGSDAALTVITMAGLRLPDLKIEREYWSAEEALALPMLHTAHRLAVRRCYGGDMYRRKLVGLDEAHFMEGWRSGRSFLVRLARDSRKWNLSALVASQNPRDILGLDVQNLVSTVFVGRIAEDSEIAAEALRLLRVPTGVGYEQTLASLSQVDSSSATRLGFREFIMRDVDGRVQKVRVDVSYVPDLLTYLDTTPASTIDPVLVGPRDPEAEHS